jgi:Flp pilus assembly protein TadD
MNARRETHRPRARVLLGWVVLLALCPAITTHAQPGRVRPASAVEAGERAIADLRVEEAAELARAALRERPDDPRAIALMGVVAFHQGDYGSAVSHLERAGNVGELGELLTTVRATRDLLAPFVSARSVDGRYQVWHAPGPDALLVPYALDALQAADRYISGVLGHRVPGPIRLEIYPDARSLAQVSSLTVQDIERSGTIALCKWDRLMVTSPRALLHGYAWTDTISHELVHLILARASRDRAPVWVQEGIAKYLEGGYRRGAGTFALDAVSQGILHEAVAADALLPFERLHPSIALLPSQRDAALAFAQVSTFVHGFHSRYGNTGIVDVIRRMAADEDARDAFAAAAGAPFAELESRWRTDVRALPSPTRPRLLPRRLVAAMGAQDDTADVAELGAEARRRLRLGDLLYGRRRFGAAAHEYAAALVIAPEDPVVAARFARSALESGQAERAVEALRPVVATHPEYAPSAALLARALEASGQSAEAGRVAQQAIRLNPFDPAPHCVLSTAGPERERPAEAQRCASLGR